MTGVPNIEIKDFIYDLPDERIAKYPLEQRDSSKMLVYKQGAIKDKLFSDCDEVLPEHGLLVYNNTKVLHARLQFTKPTGAKIEIFCLEPVAPHDYQIALQTSGKVRWKCFVGNSKKWKDEALVKQLKIKGKLFVLKAERIVSEDNAFIIEFSWNESYVFFADILQDVGEIPIPPYLNREAEKSDENNYQTVYAKNKGSVAAPTAGLHFTKDVLAKLARKGIKEQEVTLHVGAGTFQPVKSNEIKGHVMHSEVIQVKLDTLLSIIQNLGNIIAVGTTSVRTLESLYWIGLQILNGSATNESYFKVKQWEPYEGDATLPSTQLALQSLYDYCVYHQIEEVRADTQIVIIPGYTFRVVDVLVTNFHQPASTLLLLISAFVKGKWKSIYDHAIQNNYRFLSYGDSSVLFR